VYISDPTAISYTSGALTYDVGGSITVVGMTVVGSTQKLCLGKDASVAGPLLYVAGIPLGATLVEVYYTYDTDSGSHTTTRDVSAACTDYLTMIVRTTGALSCYATPTVVSSGASCDPCTEATGYTVASAGVGGTKGIYRDAICYNGSNSCTSTSATGSANWPSITLKPPNFTPSSGNRPCNWTSIEFSVTLTSSYTYSGTGTPSAGITSCAVTYTKTAGSNLVTVTCATNNAVRPGCVSGYDQLVRTAYTTPVSVWGSWDIPCTGYKLVQLHLAGTSDACTGGGRYIPDVNQIYIYLMPR
jgi:hypothetical protein